jgi:hypothetical protein
MMAVLRSQTHAVHLENLWFNGKAVFYTVMMIENPDVRWD